MPSPSPAVIGVTVATGGGYGNKIKAVITQETIIPGRAKTLRTVSCR